MWSGREPNHSPVTITEFKSERNYACSPPLYFHGVGKDNTTFTFTFIFTLTFTFEPRIKVHGLTSLADAF